MKERGREEFSVELDREMAARKRKRSSSPTKQTGGGGGAGGGQQQPSASAFQLFYSAKKAHIEKQAVEFDGREN